MAILHIHHLTTLPTPDPSIKTTFNYIGQQRVMHNAYATLSYHTNPSLCNTGKSIIVT